MSYIHKIKQIFSIQRREKSKDNSGPNTQKPSTGVGNLAYLPNYYSFVNNAERISSVFDVTLDTQKLYKESRKDKVIVASLKKDFVLSDKSDLKKFNKLLLRYIPIQGRSLMKRDHGYQDISKTFFNRLEKLTPTINKIVCKMSDNSVKQVPLDKKVDSIYTVTADYRDLEGMLCSIREFANQTINKSTTEGIFVINGPPDKVKEINEVKINVQKEIAKYKGLKVSVLTMAVPEWRFGLKSLVQLVALKRMQNAGRDKDFMLQSFDVDNTKIDKTLLEEHRRIILDYKQLIVKGEHKELNERLTQESKLLAAEDEVFNSLLELSEITDEDRRAFPVLDQNYEATVSGANYAISAFALIFSGPANISKHYGEDAIVASELYSMLSHSSLSLESTFFSSGKFVISDGDRARDAFYKEIPQFLKYSSVNKGNVATYSDKPRFKQSKEPNYDMLLCSVFEGDDVFLKQRDTSQYAHIFEGGMMVSLEAKLLSMFRKYTQDKDPKKKGEKFDKWLNFINKFHEYKYKKHIENLNRIKLFREKNISFVLVSSYSKEYMQEADFEIGIVDNESKKVLINNSNIVSNLIHNAGDYDFKIHNYKYKNYSFNSGKPQDIREELRDKNKSKYLISKLSS